MLGSTAQRRSEKADGLGRFRTFRSCMSLFAPFFSRAMVASTLLTAAAQCRADLPKRDSEPSAQSSTPASPRSRTAATPTQFIHRVDISVTRDELLHHALHRQPRRQDQGSGAVIHPGVKICRPVSDKNLGKGERRSSRSESLTSPLPQIHPRDVCSPGRRPEHLRPRQRAAASAPCCPER